MFDNLARFFSVGELLDMYVETFETILKMHREHTYVLTKGQIKSKSRLASRRFSQKTNGRI